MSQFNFIKYSPEQANSLGGPYSENSTNLMYNWLFCDSLDLYKNNATAPYTYPFDILFSETSSAGDFQKIIDDSSSETRIKLLAYNCQRAIGHQPSQKVLMAVIVEVGLDGGLDVLASFNDGTARYINQSGKIIIWEAPNQESNELTQDLFVKSLHIVNQIGPWDKPRLPHPVEGNVRISFLLSDGLYFGEGPINVLFSDALANPALTAATYLMQYLTERGL